MINSKIISPTEEAGSIPVSDSPGETEEVKELARSFLGAARRDLTQDEASSPAGVRWLQYEADRLDRECSSAKSDLRDLRLKYDSLVEAFHDQRVLVETLTGKKSLSIRNDVLSALCLASGGAGLSAGVTYLSIPQAHEMASVVIAISSILLVGGIVLRIWK